MNTLNRIMAVSILAALALHSPAARAADAEIKAKANTSSGVDVDVDVDRDRTTGRDATEARSESRVGEAGVKDANKASGLIGMEVRNQQNEKLGEIKDLVLDIQSGRLSYAVLSVGGFLGLGEKLIAVPPSALSSSSAENKLILNADKAKLQAAPGFAATSWPNPSNPDRNAMGFWDERKYGSDSGTGPRFETSANSRNAELAREQRVANIRNKEKTDTKGDASSSSSASASANRTTTGTVRSVDSDNNTITVETAAGQSKVFHLQSDARITLSNNSNPRLRDVRSGSQVTIGYHEENGRMVAHSVTNDRSDR